MMLWLFLLCSASFVRESLLQESTKLLLVQTLFRHGDRTPIASYPNDPNNVFCCPEGFGKLTLLGKRQQYEVGKYLRSMYEDFITSNPNEILVNSSTSDRCLRSAEANLASFYTPVGIWKFEKDLNWQPIPVHYVPLEKDKVLSFPECPRAFNIAMHLYNSKVQPFFLNNKKSFDELSHVAGYDVTIGLRAMDLYDTLNFEKIHNLSIPSWVEPYWFILDKSADLSGRCFYDSPELARLRAGPLLQVITDNMKGKLNGSLPDLKVHVFSSHDDLLSAMLLVLTSEDMPEPPYCATLLIELHQLQNKTAAVRVLYLNSTTPEIDVGKPKVLNVKGCSEFCPLDQFFRITGLHIPQDWNAECQHEDTGMTSRLYNSRKALLEQLVGKYFS